MKQESSAYSAYLTQGRDTPGNAGSTYSGHDSFQNGVIEPNNDITIYVAEFGSGDDIYSSGYFTDQATIDSCIHNGILDGNELGSKCQIQPSNKHFDSNTNSLVTNEGGVYQQRSNVNAYDINFDKLDSLRTSNDASDRDLYNRLTNPDGLGNESGGIKCAYGSVEANPQFGLDKYQNGGGNQYYINRDTFNAAKKIRVCLNTIPQSRSMIQIIIYLFQKFRQVLVTQCLRMRMLFTIQQM